MQHKTSFDIDLKNGACGAVTVLDITAAATLTSMASTGHKERIAVIGKKGSKQEVCSYAEIWGSFTRASTIFPKSSPLVIT